MSEHSRRNFLKTASVGAVAVGAVAVAPSAASAATTSSTDDAHPLDKGAAHDGSFTVWVKNANTGQLAVMVGESEVVYTDRKLAKRLARIAARGNS